MKRHAIAILFLLILPLLLPACGQSPAADPFSLSAGGASYRCGAPIEPVLEAFGDGYEYAEGQNCAYDSVDKTFTYPSLTFYTVPLEEGDIISEIYTEDPAVITAKGVAVGVSKADVLAAHGDTCEDLGNLLVYRAEGGEQQSLCFELDGDAVVAVFVTTEAI